MALVMQVAVNQNVLCWIALVNTGHKNEHGEHLYRFQQPATLNRYELYHDRQKPWYELIEKAIKILKKEEGDILVHGRLIPTPEEFKKMLEDK